MTPQELLLVVFCLIDVRQFEREHLYGKHS